MQTSVQNPEKLNPRELIKYLSEIVEKNTLSEVAVRRIISAIYFALFNYWSMKSYYKGLRGEGPLGDSFWYSSFNEFLLKQGLDHAAYTSYLYRVAVDHYALNPTKVVLTTRPWKGVEEEVEINDDALRKILESAYEILEALEKY